MSDNILLRMDDASCTSGMQQAKGLCVDQYKSYGVLTFKPRSLRPSQSELDCRGRQVKDQASANIGGKDMVVVVGCPAHSILTSAVR